MGVDRALGPAGRARRIEPEGRIVAAGRGRLGKRLAGGEQRVEGKGAGRERVGRAADDQVLDLVLRLRHRLAEQRRERGRDDRRLGPAVRQHVGVVVGGEQGVHRHRHDAGIEAAEEGDRPLVGVEHQQQHALLAPDAEPEQGRGEAPRPLLELAVAQAGAIVDVGDLGGAAGVDLEQVLRKIQRLGRRDVHVKHYTACMAAQDKDPFLLALGERVRLLRARRGLTRKSVVGRLGRLGAASRQPRIRHRQRLDPGAAAGRQRARLLARRAGGRHDHQLARVAAAARAAARQERRRAAPRPARAGERVRRGRRRRRAAGASPWSACAAPASRPSAGSSPTRSRCRSSS